MQQVEIVFYIDWPVATKQRNFERLIKHSRGVHLTPAVGKSFDFRNCS
jgi:hypothetical protein